MDRGTVVKIINPGIIAANGLVPWWRNFRAEGSGGEEGEMVARELEVLRAELLQEIYQEMENLPD